MTYIVITLERNCVMASTNAWNDYSYFNVQISLYVLYYDRLEEI